MSDGPYSMHAYYGTAGTTKSRNDLARTPKDSPAASMYSSRQGRTDLYGSSSNSSSYSNMNRFERSPYSYGEDENAHSADAYFASSSAAANLRSNDLYSSGQTPYNSLLRRKNNARTHQPHSSSLYASSSDYDVSHSEYEDEMYQSQNESDLGYHHRYEQQLSPLSQLQANHSSSMDGSSFSSSHFFSLNKSHNRSATHEQRHLDYIPNKPTSLSTIISHLGKNNAQQGLALPSIVDLTKPVDSTEAQSTDYLDSLQLPSYQQLIEALPPNMATHTGGAGNEFNSKTPNMMNNNNNRASLGNGNTLNNNNPHLLNTVAHGGASPMGYRSFLREIWYGRVLASMFWSTIFMLFFIHLTSFTPICSWSISNNVWALVLPFSHISSWKSLFGFVVIHLCLTFVFSISFIMPAPVMEKPSSSTDSKQKNNKTSHFLAHYANLISFRYRFHISPVMPCNWIHRPWVHRLCILLSHPTATHFIILFPLIALFSTYAYLWSSLFSFSFSSSPWMLLGVFFFCLFYPFQLLLSRSSLLLHFPLVTRTRIPHLRIEIPTILAKSGTFALKFVLVFSFLFFVSTHICQCLVNPPTLLQSHDIGTNNPVDMTSTNTTTSSSSSSATTVTASSNWGYTLSSHLYLCQFIYLLHVSINLMLVFLRVFLVQPIHHFPLLFLFHGILDHSDPWARSLAFQQLSTLASYPIFEKQRQEMFGPLIYLGIEDQLSQVGQSAEKEQRSMFVQKRDSWLQRHLQHIKTSQSQSNPSAFKEATEQENHNHDAEQLFVQSAFVSIATVGLNQLYALMMKLNQITHSSSNTTASSSSTSSFTKSSCIDGAGLWSQSRMQLIGEIFADFQVHRWTIQTLSSFTIKSLTEDQYGVVQDWLPAIFSTLFSLSFALDEFVHSSSFISSAQDSVLQGHSYTIPLIVNIAHELDLALAQLVQHFQPYMKNKAWQIDDRIQKKINSYAQFF